MTIKSHVIIVIVGVFVGILSILQFRSVPEFVYSKTEVDERKYVLETLLNEQAVLKNQIITLRKQVEIKQDEIKEYRKNEDLLRELDIIKKTIGLKEVKGKGIIVYLDDSPDVVREDLDINNNSLIHASDIRDILNILRFSSSQGMSVNNQRVVITTPVSCVGNSILVNNSHLLPPITIKAVGDPEVFLNNLKNDSHLVDLKTRKRENDVVFEYTADSSIVIPVYNSDLNYKFIQ